MYKIKNWLSYQHYGDKKKVPWIKLHYEILTGEDFSEWDNNSKLLAIVCMLIASRHNGCVPNNPKHVQRLGNLDSLPDFNPLISSGFLVELTQDEVVLNNSRQNQILCAPESEIKNQKLNSDKESDVNLSGFFNQNFDLDMIISDDTRQKARDLANGWDLYRLISLFNEQVRSGSFKKPTMADAAFLAWIRSFTKGKRP